jgi:hypothetical protein
MPPEVEAAKESGCDFCDNPAGRVFEIRDKFNKARRACVTCIEAVMLKVITLLSVTHALTSVLDLV